MYGVPCTSSNISPCHLVIRSYILFCHQEIFYSRKDIGVIFYFSIRAYILYSRKEYNSLSSCHQELFYYFVIRSYILYSRKDIGVIFYFSIRTYILYSRKEYCSRKEYKSLSSCHQKLYSILSSGGIFYFFHQKLYSILSSGGIFYFSIRSYILYSRKEYNSRKE